MSEIRLTDAVVLTQPLSVPALIGDAGAVMDQLVLDVEALIAGQNAGVVSFATRAILEDSLDYDEGATAYVTNDDVDPVVNNGTYRKVGASGVGSWEIASTAAQAALMYKQVIRAESYAAQTITRYASNTLVEIAAVQFPDGAVGVYVVSEFNTPVPAVNSFEVFIMTGVLNGKKFVQPTITRNAQGDAVAVGAEFAIPAMTLENALPTSLLRDWNPALSAYADGDSAGTLEEDVAGSDGTSLTTARPIFHTDVLANLPVLRFDGVDDNVEIPLIGPYASLDIFFLGSFADFAASRPLLGTAEATEAYVQATTATNVRIANSAGTTFTVSVPALDTDPHVYHWRIITGAPFEFRIDGTLIVTDTENVAGTFSFDKIGSRAGQRFKGDLGRLNVDVSGMSLDAALAFTRYLRATARI